MDTGNIAWKVTEEIMNQYALRIPESLFEAAKKCAEEDNVSMNQFFVVAIAEKVAALKTANYFQEKAKGADVQRYFEVLEKVKDMPLVPGDEIDQG
jgi:hypothetical protein